MVLEIAEGVEIDLRQVVKEVLSKCGECSNCNNIEIKIKIEDQELSSVRELINYIYFKLLSDGDREQLHIPLISNQIPYGYFKNILDFWYHNGGSVKVQEAVIRELTGVLGPGNPEVVGGVESKEPKINLEELKKLLENFKDNKDKIFEILGIENEDWKGAGYRLLLSCLLQVGKCKKNIKRDLSNFIKKNRNCLQSSDENCPKNRFTLGGSEVLVEDLKVILNKLRDYIDSEFSLR